MASFRLMLVVITNFVVIASFLTVGAAPAPDEAYDLRGPVPKLGRITRDAHKINMTNSDITIDLGNNKKFVGKTDMTITAVKEEEVLAIVGNKIAKLRTKVLKDETVRKSTLNGETQNETDKKALVGELVLSELTKEGWKHYLENSTPNDKQMKELKDFDEPESDRDLYPMNKVRVGQSWNIDANAFRNALGSKLSDAEGSGKGKLRRIEKFDDQLCAFIEIEIDLKGRIKQEDNEVEIEMKGKMNAYRSLANAIDLKFTFDGTLKFEGTVAVNNTNAHVLHSGKMSSEGATKIIK